MAYVKVASGLAHLKSKLQFRASLFKLGTDKTYIFPTGFGFSFGILSFILLAMAIGYGNNILYFFVFLLVSMGMTSSLLTNKNIDSVKIKNINAELIFANEKNLLSAKVENLNQLNTNLFDLEFRIEYEKYNNKELHHLIEIETMDNVLLNWRPENRGAVDSPRILIQSRFPFKLLRAWKYYRAKTQILVYPERKGQLGLRTLLGEQSNRDEMAKIENEGLFRDFRDFQNTDSPNRIDWRRSVKYQKHLVKNYERSGDRKILIDWEMTKNIIGIEERISQLALWVDICLNANEVFALKIKNFQTDYYSGLQHYKLCMEKLALLSAADLE